MKENKISNKEKKLSNSTVVPVVAGLAMGYAAGKASAHADMTHNASLDDVVDAVAVDVDGDGVVDAVAVDVDGDGVVDAVAVDVDGDGVVDAVAVDVDGDGVVDEISEGDDIGELLDDIFG